ncbi:MAG: hypothetical protein IPM34_11255 [Saprospiraceae bacterium]|nr:hypothetical protein [Saprospiraceae bacterium]
MPIDEINWPQQTKKSWLNQVLQDNPSVENLLNGFNDLNAIHRDPFSFYTDLPVDSKLNIASLMPEKWHPGTLINLVNLERAQNHLSLALDNGVEYLVFNVIENLDAVQLAWLFQNVRFDYFQSSWIFPDKFETYKHLHTFLKSELKSSQRFISNTQNIFSSGIFDNAQFSISDLKLSPASTILLNAIKLISVDLGHVKSLTFKFYLQDDFILNIAFLRAFRIVVKNIVDLFEIDIDYKFEGRINSSCFSDNQHYNLIVASSISTSAILGGVDYLIPELPFENEMDVELKWKKTSIHLQHILIQESKLNGLRDPLAGSYHIDDLTVKYANAIWSTLQKKIKNDS